MLFLKKIITKFIKQIPYTLFIQKDLIELKKRLPERIRKTQEGIKKEQSNNSTADFLRLLEHRDALTRDLLKIKKAITSNNFLFGINSLLYKRELIFKKLEFLKTTSIQKSEKQEFFRELITKNFNIDVAINKLQKQLTKIEAKQKKINNSYLTISLLTLETI